jgi:hypothetical protein
MHSPWLKEDRICENRRMKPVEIVLRRGRGEERE